MVDSMCIHAPWPQERCFIAITIVQNGNITAWIAGERGNWKYYSWVAGEW